MRVILTKRDHDVTASGYTKSLTFGRQLPADVEAYIKRTFSDDKRKELADKGHALPDGSFPIESKGDLKNAIQAIGRAKDPAKAKAHIKSRAKDLGAEDMIPDTWSKRDVSTVDDNVIDLPAFLGKNAVDFDTAAEFIEVAEDAGELMHEVREALCALDCAINSIMCDEDVTDKAACIAESFEQFKSHLAALEAGDLEKTMSKDNNLAAGPAVEKMIADAVAKAMENTNAKHAAELAKKDQEIAVAKMSDKHKAFHDGLGSEEEKKKFSGMSPAERDAHMDKMKKGAMDDPIIKAALLENDELRKRIAVLEDTQMLSVCKKDAADMGMTDADAGETLMKARRGDVAALAKIEAFTKTITKQRDEARKTARLFNEFGTGHGNGGEAGSDALSQLYAKRDELRKKEPTLTEAQAFEKVLLDPANKELAEQERSERMNKIASRAA